MSNRKWEIVVGKSLLENLVGNCRGHIVVGNSCVKRSCRKFLQENLAGNCSLGLTLVGNSSGKILREILAGKSCGKLLWDNLPGNVLQP